MATNKPDSRQTHITRIFGTNRAGELLSDVWVDVERMDVVKSALQVPPHLQWQAVQRKFRWCDDPAADDYSPDGTPSRNIEILKVCDPDSEDVDNPGEWVPVKVIKAIRQRVETGTQDQGGTAMDRFLASVTAEELTTERVVEVRRTVHRDTNIDNAADAAADAGQKEYVVPSEAYEKDADSKDDGQYIEQEIITYLKHRGNANEVMGQGRQTKLLNEYLIEQSEPPKNEVVGDQGLQSTLPARSLPDHRQRQFRFACRRVLRRELHRAFGDAAADAEDGGLDLVPRAWRRRWRAPRLNIRPGRRVAVPVHL
jgi:hypothetical protein